MPSRRWTSPSSTTHHHHHHHHLPPAHMIDVWQYAPVLVAVALLLLYRNSLPFAWTLRTGVPYLRVRLGHLSSRLAERAKTTTNHANGTLSKTVNEQHADLTRAPSAQGCDPFQDTWAWHSHATLDDCDYTGTLSNSAFAKNLDVARVHFATHRLADFLRDGGWVALASTSFTFHHPVPFLSRYSVEQRIETWSDKWLYMRSEFRGRRSSGGEPIVYCTAITKHCFKYGRKTLSPWFVLAYCGYSGASEATLRATNAARSRQLRAALETGGGKSSSCNPLQEFERSTSKHEAMRRSVPAWCLPDAWDVAGWEAQRTQRLAGLWEE